MFSDVLRHQWHGIGTPHQRGHGRHVRMQRGEVQEMKGSRKEATGLCWTTGAWKTLTPHHLTQPLHIPLPWLYKKKFQRTTNVSVLIWTASNRIMGLVLRYGEVMEPLEYSLGSRSGSLRWYPLLVPGWALCFLPPVGMSAATLPLPVCCSDVLP